MSQAHETEVAEASAQLERALIEVKKVVVGQDAMVERMLIGLLARGHLLLEGVPGVAKTLAVRTLADVVGGSFARLQFTPDLMPGDITGSRVWRASTETFDVERGPIFANLVLADEINRAPAKVQSALLEAMAEKQVSIAGTSHALPTPFLVLATQNPVESEGVYRLPEAQRDRFLLKVDVPYPTGQEEFEILHRMSVDPPRADQVFGPDDVVRLQQVADGLFVHHSVSSYLVNLTVATRAPERYCLPHLNDVIELGVSPRASLGMLAAGRALALLRGRSYVLPADIVEIAADVMSPRLMLSFDAVADGLDPRQVIREIIAAVPQPTVASREDPDGRHSLPRQQPDPAPHQHGQPDPQLISAPGDV
ncbi:MoxR family ATPase [soil metagenome]